MTYAPYFLFVLGELVCALALWREIRRELKRRAKLRQDVEDLRIAEAIISSWLPQPPKRDPRTGQFRPQHYGRFVPPVRFFDN